MTGKNDAACGDRKRSVGFVHLDKSISTRSLGSEDGEISEHEGIQIRQSTAPAPDFITPIDPSAVRSRADQPQCIVESSACSTLLSARDAAMRLSVSILQPASPAASDLAFSIPTGLPIEHDQ